MINIKAFFYQVLSNAINKASISIILTHETKYRSWVGISYVIHYANSGIQLLIILKFKK